MPVASIACTVALQSAVARRWLVVVAILLIALGLRVGEISRTSYRPVFDAGSYLTLGSEVARTGDYADSHRSGKGAGGTRGPTAYFPPGYPYFLAAVDLIDGHPTKRGPAILPARYAQAALGTVTVALVGLIAYECFGFAVALVALALAAIYPVFIELSAVLVAENLLTALMLAAVWATLRARRARSDGRRFAWIAAAGVLCGLAALAHVNGVVLIVPLLFGAWAALSAPPDTGAQRPARAAPPPLRFSARPRRRRAAGAVVVMLAAAVLTVAPWTIRNAIVMHRFIAISDETGITLVGTYNAASAHDRAVPYKWRYYLAIPRDRHLLRQARHETEPQLGARLESQALHYIARHPLAPLAASAHNLLRLLELEGSFAWRASAASIDLDAGTARIGVIGFWVIGLLALAGIALGAGRGAPRWLWAVPILFALSVVPVNAETPRFREPIDPFLVLLAAGALVSAGRLVAAGRRRASASAADGLPASAGVDALGAGRATRVGAGQPHGGPTRGRGA